MSLTVNDFFCGAGGMGLGFQKAGYIIAGAWDFDKYAVQSYRENVGDHVKQADIRAMNWTDVPKANVWTFGFPCQDLSVAGKMSGLQIECFSCGHKWTIQPEEYTSENVCPNCNSTRLKSANRSGLLFEIMRLLEETREHAPEQLPEVILAENVKGLRPFLPVLKSEYEKRGYVMYYQLFNSKYWGVPQNRQRYFVIGIRKELDTGSYTFPAEIPGNVPKLSSILETDVPAKFYISDEKAQTIIDQALKKLDKLGSVHATITPDRIDKRQNGRRAKCDEEEMFTLTAQDLHGVIIEEPQLEIAGHLDQPGHEQRKRVYDMEGLSPTLTALAGGDQQIKILEPQLEIAGHLDQPGHEQRKRVYDPNGLAPTIMGTNKTDHAVKIIANYRARKLTPREYARLQAFPDSYRLVVSNSQLYKQFGNAVTVTVAEAQAKAIKIFLSTLLTALND